MDTPLQISAKVQIRKANYERLIPNWIGGGATRPITQGRRQYSIFAQLRVNKLDDLKANKADKVFVNRRRQIALMVGTNAGRLLGQFDR
jgi:hypothetical protein